MAEQLNIKELYETSLPTPENIDEVYNLLNLGNFMADRNTFVTISNKMFGMLAHLRIETLTSADHYKVIPLMESRKYQKFISILGILRITAPNACCSDAGLSPSARPIVKQWIALFEAYEKENGISAPYAVKEE